MEEIKYEMGMIMEGLPPNVIGTLKGSIIAKADKIDIQEAINFIEEKEKEGLITSDMAGKLARLIKHYSLYR